MGRFTTAPFIERHPANPILSAKDVPYDATLVYNAGVCKYQGKYVMIFRNDVYSKPEIGCQTHINLGLAFSDDGANWDVQARPCITRETLNDDDVLRVYDPRLTVIDSECILCFAVDTKHGLRGGMARTDDFQNFEVLSLTVPDNRNMVLFPETIGGHYVRLERPFPVYSRGTKERFDIWLSESPDLEFWGRSRLVTAVEDFAGDMTKIGPGAPPVKTDKGWLTLIHTVDTDSSRGKNGWEDVWPKFYYGGVMLLDLEEPSKVIGYAREPIMVPEAEYETSGGIRNNVIFPGGMILEDSGEVKIYYGAADTVECLATAHVDDLLKACLG